MVLGDFNVHAKISFHGGASDFMVAMVTLRLSQVVSTPVHEAGHMLDLIVYAGLDLNSVAISKPVPQSDHFLQGQ